MLGSNCIHLFLNKLGWLIGRFMVFNATFNNISVIWRQSVLLVEETGVPAEDHRPPAEVYSIQHYVI